MRYPYTNQSSGAGQTGLLVEVYRHPVGFEGGRAPTDTVHNIIMTVTQRAFPYDACVPRAVVQAREGEEVTKGLDHDMREKIEGQSRPRVPRRESDCSSDTATTATACLSTETFSTPFNAKFEEV